MSGIDVIRAAVDETVFERADARASFLEEMIAVPSATGLPLASSISNGSLATTASDVANTVGVWRMSTSTNATGRAAWTTLLSTLILGGGPVKCETRWNVATLSTAAERYGLVCGLVDTVSTLNSVDGAYFLYDEGGVATGGSALANWQCVTVSNSVRTFTDTGAAVVEGAWERLRVEVNADASEAKFYIDDVLEATHTTNIPTGLARSLGIGATLLKSIGTTARTVDADYVAFDAEFTTPRT